MSSVAIPVFDSLPQPHLLPGIGKTVEAGLVAREMLDRGEITRLCVLCPPHLAEQWQRELAEKFNIAAELVLSSTAGAWRKTSAPRASQQEAS